MMEDCVCNGRVMQEWGKGPEGKRPVSTMPNINGKVFVKEVGGLEGRRLCESEGEGSR